MPWVGFEPTIPASERAKTVHALERAATENTVFCYQECVFIVPLPSNGCYLLSLIVDEVDFFNLPNPSSQHYGPGVDSASNRNEYQDDSWGTKGGRCVRLTTLPPSVSRLSRENVGTSTSHNPMGLHGLLQGKIFLPILSQFIRALIYRFSSYLF
jgi:hypothetical protein